MIVQYPTTLGVLPRCVVSWNQGTCINVGVALMLELSLKVVYAFSMFSALFCLLVAIKKIYITHLQEKDKTFAMTL